MDIQNHTFTNPVSEQIWKNRYQKNGETHEGNFRRVAKFCAKNLIEENEFYDLMLKGLFMPAGRVMSNAMIGTNLTLCNCFTSPPIEDNLKNIFKKVTLGAMTHQCGGGIGYDFSQIRPNGCHTSNDAIASGPVSFMDVFNAQTETILQGGRRGANMGIMSVYHPDIKEFVTCKSLNAKRLDHFNLSVMVDDAFLDAVKNNRSIHLHFPVYDKNGKIDNTVSHWKIDKEVAAVEIWDLILRNAYDNGEPGVFFYDTLNKDNNLAYTETITTTNPCSEYLSGVVFGEQKKTSKYGGACNLGSLMLQNFVVNPFQKDRHVDYKTLGQTIVSAVRFLDNIIDVTNYPSKIYKNYQNSFRTIGLGVTGLADMLAMMGLKYNSHDARKFADDLMEFISRTAFYASILLATLKSPFPSFCDKFVQGGYLKKKSDKEYWTSIQSDILKHGIRNAKILSIAPTGTMSLVFGNNCSSGIEPIFALSYDRKIKVGGQSDDASETFSMRDYAYDVWKNTDIDKRDVGEDVFVTALDIDVNDHIDMLGVIAKHVDMSVSKTVNVPEDYTFDQTKDIYMRAHSLGIKGCTIFRPSPLRPGIFSASGKDDNSSDKKSEDKNNSQENNSQVNNSQVNNSQENNFQVTYNTISPVSRKTIGITSGNTYCKRCACGTLYITVNRDSGGNVVETFVNSSKSGICTACTSAINRMVSLAMRSGIKVEEIVDQLKGIICPACTRVSSRNTKIDGLSCPDIIAKTIVEFCNTPQDPAIKHSIRAKTYTRLPSKTSPAIPKCVQELDKSACPECGYPIVHEGGCVTCKECGWSKCG